MVEHSTAKTLVGYGAGPVSVPLTRGRHLVEAPTASDSSGVVLARRGRRGTATPRTASR